MKIYCIQIKYNIYLKFQLRYYIKSGNVEHPDDKLQNASLHIKTENPIPDSILPKNYVKTSDDFYVIDSFSKDVGVVGGTIDPEITGKITDVRIHISSSSDTWILITEISLT